MQYAVPTEGREFAVVLDTGHSDVGSTYEAAISKKVGSYEEAIVAIEEGREAVLDQFVAAVQYIHDGICDGFLTNDGGSQYVVAQVVTRGEDDEILPCEGFYLACNPAAPAVMEVWDWDECEWTELF